MERHELHSLRRQARRDGDLGNGPLRLFGEVIDLTIMDECRAKYTTLAAWLGTTERTIRRWRDRLVEAGYLRVKDGSTDRLIPTKPAGDETTDRTEMSGEPDESVRTSASDRTNMSAEPDNSVRSGPDNSVRDMRDNKSHAEGLESESESAPAREEHRGDGAPQGTPTLSVSAYDDLRNHPAVEVHDDVFPAVQLGAIQRERIAATVSDLDVWREVLEWWALQDHRARSIARQLRKFEEDLNEHRSDEETGHADPNDEWALADG